MGEHTSKKGELLRFLEAESAYYMNLYAAIEDVSDIEKSALKMKELDSFLDKLPFDDILKVKKANMGKEYHLVLAHIIVDMNKKLKICTLEEFSAQLEQDIDNDKDLYGTLLNVLLNNIYFRLTDIFHLIKQKTKISAKKDFIERQFFSYEYKDSKLILLSYTQKPETVTELSSVLDDVEDKFNEGSVENVEDLNFSCVYKVNRNSPISYLLHKKDLTPIDIISLCELVNGYLQKIISIDRSHVQFVLAFIGLSLWKVVDDSEVLQFNQKTTESLVDSCRNLYEETPYYYIILRNNKFPKVFDLAFDLLFIVTKLSERFPKSEKIKDFIISLQRNTVLMQPQNGIVEQINPSAHNNVMMIKANKMKKFMKKGKPSKPLRVKAIAKYTGMTSCNAGNQQLNQMATIPQTILQVKEFKLEPVPVGITRLAYFQWKVKFEEYADAKAVKAKCPVKHCAICHESFKNNKNQEVQMMSVCTHLFCKKCISDWHKLRGSESADCKR